MLVGATAHSRRHIVCIVANAVRTLAAAERHVVGARRVHVTIRVTEENRVAFSVYEIAPVGEITYAAVPGVISDGSLRQPEAHCCVRTV